MTLTQTHTVHKIFLLRHALATPPNVGGADIARILSPKGLEDAAALGQLMIRKGYVPDLILCSTATRTRQTLEKLLESLPSIKTEFVSDLYNCGTDCYAEKINDLGNEVNNVLVIGHNPCIYEYAIRIAGNGRDALLRRLLEGYKPATLSVLKCETDDWGKLKSKSCELIDLLDPLDYNAPARPTRWT